MALTPCRTTTVRQVTNAVAGGSLLADKSATGSGKGFRFPLSSRKNRGADLTLTDGPVVRKTEGQDVSQVLERQLSGGAASTSKVWGRNGPTRKRRLEGAEALEKPNGRSSNGEAKVVSRSAALEKLAEIHDTLLQSGKAEDCAKLVQSMTEEGRWSAKQIDRALKGGRIVSSSTSTQLYLVN